VIIICSTNKLLSHSCRFIKSQYVGKRATPGSHSSRAYIETRNSEKSDYGAKSSALSDTSEAPSLGESVSCQ
jgi:myosin-15